MWHVVALACATGVAACGSPGTRPLEISTSVPAWEAESHLQPVPVGPLGSDIELANLADPPTPARVRLGRWLFYDSRLSADGSVACATCHRPEYAFSEPTPVSSGVKGQTGRRKAPVLVNQAVTLYPHFFRDGRAASLEEQALEPIASPAEMGNTHEGMLRTLEQIKAYRRYFAEAFGSSEIRNEHVAKALADYVRTRMSGNSAWDRWRRHGDESAVSDQVKQGHALFFGKAGCNQCHFGSNFTDSSFHNLGVGWNPQTKRFSDEGRYSITKQTADMAAFKTPTLREVTKHAPYMHDGSVSTLREVLQSYNRGGETNPYLDPRIHPLNLTEPEIDALLAFLHALEGEGYADVSPKAFPQ